MLPKNLVVYMLQDLVQADSDRMELQLTNQQVLDQHKFIMQQTELIMQQQEKYAKLYEVTKMVEEDRDTLAYRNVALVKSSDELKRSRKQWRIASIGQSLILLLILL